MINSLRIENLTKLGHNQTANWVINSFTWIGPWFNFPECKQRKTGPGFLCPINRATSTNTTRVWKASKTISLSGTREFKIGTIRHSFLIDLVARLQSHTDFRKPDNISGLRYPYTNSWLPCCMFSRHENSSLDLIWEEAGVNMREVTQPIHCQKWESVSTWGGECVSLMVEC